MNVGVSNRDLLPPAVSEELETMSTRIRTGWTLEHDTDGHHTNITAKTIVTTGLISVGSDPLSGTLAARPRAGSFVYLSASQAESYDGVSSVIHQLAPNITLGAVVRSIFGHARLASASGNFTSIKGIVGRSSVMSSGSVNNMYGIQGAVALEQGSGNASEAIAVLADVEGRISGATGTITNGYGLYVILGTGITNKYGIYIADATARNVLNQAEFADGSSTAPSVKFANDTDTGLYLKAADALGLAANTVWQSENLNGAISHRIENISAGASASASLELYNDGGLQTQLVAFGSGVATVGNATALVAVNDLYLQSNAAVIRVRPGGVETATWLNAGHFVVQELTVNPSTSVLAANAAVAIYTKANTLVFAFNNAGTMTYVKLALDGSDVTWSQDTTAP
jgi:hypothetical protein